MPCLYGLRGGQKTTNHRLTERSVDWRRFLICWYLLKTGDFGYLFLAYKKPSLFVDDTQSMNSSIPRPLWSSDRCMCCVQSRTLLANLLCNELLGVAGKWRGEWNTKKKSLLIEWYYRRYSSLTMCHYKLAFHTFGSWSCYHWKSLTLPLFSHVFPVKPALFSRDTSPARSRGFSQLQKSAVTKNPPKLGEVCWDEVHDHPNKIQVSEVS